MCVFNIALARAWLDGAQVQSEPVTTSTNKQKIGMPRAHRMSFQYPLSAMGRISLSKMLLLPCLYVLKNSMYPRTIKVFKALDSLMRLLVWAGRPSSVNVNILKLPW